MLMRDSRLDWYKDAIFYEVYVRGFFDGNGDGNGDLRGLIEKLDYLADLGVDCLWLMPIFASPLKDDGYDIADFYKIHPAIGDVADFEALTRAAHERGIRVIADLVLNHTSDQHPWFQEARRDPKSPKRDYYVWSDTDTQYKDVRVIFNDVEQSNWTWDTVARQYYWHRFFSHQPDLNFDNPAVQDEILKVIGYWLDRGIDGFRVDAIPYLFEREGTTCENLPETHDYIRRIRKFIDDRYPGAMILAEANQWPTDIVKYFGAGDEFHMAFNFPLMPRMFMAVRREQALPIIEIMQQMPEIPAGCQWALFLRNHDELTLEMVTDDERDYMVREYAKDPRMRINMGIRRRLAPLMDHDRSQIVLLHSLLLTLPGAPVLYYGDEIGMGDNIYLGDRNSVRTPMHWTGDRNAGFSKADPSRLYAPLIQDPVYTYYAVNVEAQLRSPTSLYYVLRRLIRIRKKFPEFARGSLKFVPCDNHRIVAFLRQLGGRALFVVHNLSAVAQPVQLRLEGFEGSCLVELLGNQIFPPIGAGPYFLSMAPHSFFWFLIGSCERPEPMVVK
jgi:maltose alpha-D-glucosyltransferase/alpha-amylase